MLEKSPVDRIGCGKMGSDEIKNHPFFKEIDWAALIKKEVTPPFVPDSNGTDDT